MQTQPAAPWRVRHQSGPSSTLFGDDPLAAPVERSITVRRVDGPTVVLGSAQHATVVDAGRASSAGVAVVRRRSGGGAVWLDPSSITWLDITIPASDPLWEPDVGRAFWWVGDTWVAALAAIGAGSVEVHRGGLRSTSWSRTVCFAGLGPGEVHQGDAKVVGIAQRRTRVGVLFQCGVLHHWDPGPLLHVLALTGDERADGATTLRAAGSGVSPHGLLEQFLATLDERTTP